MQVGETHVVLVGVRVCVSGGASSARGELGTWCSREQCSDTDEVSVTCPSSCVNDVVLCSSITQWSDNFIYVLYMYVKL